MILFMTIEEKKTKIVSYDLQDFWKNSDVTPVKDTDTLDQWEHKPRGRPYDQKTIKQGKWMSIQEKLGGISY